MLLVLSVALLAFSCAAEPSATAAAPPANNEDGLGNSTLSHTSRLLSPIPLEDLRFDFKFEKTVTLPSTLASKLRAKTLTLDVSIGFKATIDGCDFSLSADSGTFDLTANKKQLNQINLNIKGITVKAHQDRVTVTIPKNFAGGLDVTVKVILRRCSKNDCCFRYWNAYARAVFQITAGTKYVRVGPALNMPPGKKPNGDLNEWFIRKVDMRSLIKLHKTAKKMDDPWNDHTCVDNRGAVTTPPPLWARSKCRTLPSSYCTSGEKDNAKDNAPCAGATCTKAADEAKCCKGQALWGWIDYTGSTCKGGSMDIPGHTRHSTGFNLAACKDLCAKTPQCSAVQYIGGSNCALFSGTSVTKGIAFGGGCSVMCSGDRWRSIQDRAKCSTYSLHDCTSGEKDSLSDNVICAGATCTKAADEAKCCKSRCSTYSVGDCASGEKDAMKDNAICAGATCTKAADEAKCCKAKAQCSTLPLSECTSGVKDTSKDNVPCEGATCTKARDEAKCCRAYVTEITSISSDSPGLPSGYLSENTNDGFGGKYVYVKPTYGAFGAACTGFKFYSRGSSKPSTYQSSIYWNRGTNDLAEGAGGAYRYIIPTYEVGKSAVVKVFWTTQRWGHLKCTDDINMGRGGRYLYLCWETETESSCPEKYPKCNGDKNCVTYACTVTGYCNTDHAHPVRAPSPHTDPGNQFNYIDGYDGSGSHCTGDYVALSNQNAGCHRITTEEQCLASKDGRRGRPSYSDSPCRWCCGQACTTLNANKCEPESWLLFQSSYTGKSNSGLPDRLPWQASTCPVGGRRLGHEMEEAFPTGVDEQIVLV